MSVSPENTSPDPAPETGTGRAHPLLRPILSCTAAVAIAIMLAPWILKPPPESKAPAGKSVAIHGADIALAVLAPTRKFGFAEGSLTATSAVEGHAPTSGLVARLLVEQGALVKKGQPVMEISVGSNVRPAPAAERQQDRAEQSQVSAVQEQDELANKIVEARGRLADAEANIAAAQERVETAKQLIRDLKAGKPVSQESTRPVSRSSPKSGISTTDQAALLEAQRTSKEADSAEQALFAAQDKVRATEAAARTATEEVNRATSKVTKVEDLYNREVMTASDVQAARTAAMEAQDKATDATNKAFAAKQEAQRLEKKAQSARAAADKAAKRVAGGLSNVRIFDAPEPPPAPSPDKGSNVTLAQASKMVADALDQGREAARTAERLHAEIKGYEQQVENSKSHVASSTERLQAAQQRVLDSMPKATMVPVFAPRDGAVMWTANLAQDVKKGQAVFALAEGGLMGEVKDSTGWWRRVQPGNSVPALVPPPATGAPGSPGYEDSVLKGTIVTINVAKVIPGDKGTPGIIRGAVAIPPSRVVPVPVRPGMRLVASMVTSDNAPALQVPSPCVLTFDGLSYVAVLTENRELGMTHREFAVQWRPVTLGEEKAGRLDILQGLAPGDRVLRTPELLPPPTGEGQDITAVLQS